ncbi:MAG: hypothetical protein KDM81_13295, partial [Verrucomicrobiae bacterium]|nr:hypothetical protein [Verrucomicrobiae bacterium]
MPLKDQIGFTKNGPALASPDEVNRLREFVNLKLAARGFPIVGKESDYPFLDLGRSLIASFQEKTRLLSDYLCPADAAIDAYLHDYLGEEIINDVFPDRKHLVPGGALVAERHGITRMLSLPPDADEFKSSILSSYRVHQGVCHNPASDRRTTEGVFHVTEGGLPIPADKKSVPKIAFARLLKAALNPPQEIMTLPFTGTSPDPAKVFISILLRPVVAPEVPGVSPEKSMEVRFFAPGNLVSNLDFVERIFGNAGDPYLPQNDAGLDVDHWSGHTGCVILAPHLIELTKKAVGLPHWDQATERQRRDGMCWQDENEKYNDGSAFKVVCRDLNGVIVTLIADNYFGYSKKEIKSQISYATNLFGGCEEEHSGGALAFPRFNLGDSYILDSKYLADGHTYAELQTSYADLIDFRPEGYGVDRNWRQVIFLPEDARLDLLEQRATWQTNGEAQSLKLLAGYTYFYPCGLKVHLQKHPHAPSWRLVGTEAEGTFCYKPCTVSGGGKSEISKSLVSALLSGPYYVQNLKEDLDQVEVIFQRDFSTRYKSGDTSDQRGLLDMSRTLGSVIRLLTPSEEYSQEYNAWLTTIPQHIRALV